MFTDPQDRVEELFHACLERDSGDRAAFLDTACADDSAVREEVESLLAAHEQAAGLPDAPAWSMFVATPAPAPEPSDMPQPEEGLPFENLGEYRLIRRLGEGGMGVVYLAIQESLHRQVALKVVRPERLASPEVAERFRREADSISRLRHDHIVTVYGSGEDQSVRYFAMELVQGGGLDEILGEAAARGERIPIPRLGAWIRDVARALHCAHESRIIHRDVKPSNIRITPEGRAMLMDFGVARHEDLASLTLTGQFRGTPHYSSPEQVKAQSREIDARTDVYSLGATLYEGVTGRLPFEGETTEQVFKQILDEDPVAPHRLNPSIARDLETVIATAMAKDPGRRYPSCAAFADDLERFLGGEMILAKPAGLATRAWKRVRRHPVASTAAGVGLLAAVGLVLYVVLFSYPRIVRERDLAEEQRRAAEIARTEAETEAAKARAINEFIEEMLSSADPELGDKDVRVADVLASAEARVEGALGDQPEIEAAVRNTIGNTYRSLGRYPEAERQHRAAVGIHTELFGEEHRDTLDSTNMLAHAVLGQGRHAEAEELYARILETSVHVLGAEDPATVTYMSNLALVLSEQGKLAEAEAVQLEALEICPRVLGEEHPLTIRLLNNLAIVLAQQNKADEAAAQLRRILEIQERLGAGESHIALQAMCNLALVLSDLGRPAEAEELLVEALAVYGRDFGAAHPETMKSASSLAVVRIQLGRLAEAEALLRETHATQIRTLGPESPDLLMTEFNLARAVLLQGRAEEAEELQRELIPRAQRVLGRFHPNVLGAVRSLSRTLRSRGAHDEAAALLIEAFEELETSLGVEHPSTQAMLRALVEVEEERDRPEEAEGFRSLLSSGDGDGAR